MRTWTANILLGTVMAAAVVACGPDRPRSQPEARLEKSVVAAVDSLRSAYVSAYNAGDTTAVTSLFAEEAVYLPPAASAREGRAAIRSYLAGELAEEPRLELTSSATHVVTGAWAVEHGTWTVTVTPQSAAKERRISGSYLAMVRRVGGGWKFARFADTYDALPTLPLPEAMK